MNGGHSRSSSPADAPGAPVRAPEADLRRRRLRHDIRHELGTIIMLASAVAVADDVGPGSRERIEQLIGETRWLEHLIQRLDLDPETEPAGPAVPGGGGSDGPPGTVRVDEVAVEVAAGMRLATGREIALTTEPAWAHMDPLALWRALRNVLDNACRAAETRVELTVAAGRGWVVVKVADDGPGFGAGRAATSSLGLGIVRDLVSAAGGVTELDADRRGGALVRLLLPSAPPSGRP